VVWNNEKCIESFCNMLTTTSLKISTNFVAFLLATQNDLLFTGKDTLLAECIKRLSNRSPNCCRRLNFCYELLEETWLNFINPCHQSGQLLIHYSTFFVPESPVYITNLPSPFKIVNWCFCLRLGLCKHE